MFHKYAARHRGTPSAPLSARIAGNLRRVALSSGVAVGATCLVVSSGVLAQSPTAERAASASLSSAARADAEVAEREERISRAAGERQALAERAKAQAAKAAQARAAQAKAARAKARAQAREARRAAASRALERARANPKQLARTLMPEFGMPASQFSCLDNLYASESEWKVNADNPTSSAYGIPQALPGSKMSSAGPDWENNPETQIRWGLGYIKDRYGTACEAWSFKQGAGWY